MLTSQQNTFCLCSEKVCHRKQEKSIPALLCSLLFVLARRYCLSKERAHSVLWPSCFSFELSS